VQERLPGVGHAARGPTACPGGRGLVEAGGLVCAVEAARGEANDGGVLGDVVQRGARLGLPRDSILGLEELGGGWHRELVRRRGRGRVARAAGAAGGSREGHGWVDKERHLGLEERRR
jgi:hypothetical protein